jgi:hypothetical protein
VAPTRARGLNLTVGFGALFALDAFVDLFPVHGNFLGGVDADPDLVSFYTQYRNGYIAPDHHSLSSASRKDQHSFLLLPYSGFALIVFTLCITLNPL